MATTSRPFAVITGASSGIGFELAKQFAQNNHDILIAAEDDGIILAAEQLSVFGTHVTPLRVDLAKDGGVDRLYQEIKATGLAVDAIAINAGVGVGGAFIDTALEDELNMIALNVTSSVHLAKHVVKDMAMRGRGRVLFTASVVSTIPAPYEAIYGATKAFLLSFSDALRNELKDKGVSVTALMPGATETNFFHRADLDDTRVGQSKKDDPADVAKMGFDALMAGDAHVVAASWKSKTLGMLGEILPEGAKAEIHAQMSKPGSGSK